eukprot:14804230-Alexandrium_andersonii.AAC.1
MGSPRLRRFQCLDVGASPCAPAGTAARSIESLSISIWFEEAARSRNYCYRRSFCNEESPLDPGWLQRCCCLLYTSDAADDM